MFTQTPWYIVPLVWLPIAALLVWKSLHQQPGATLIEAATRIAPYFVLGNFIWTVSFSRLQNAAYPPWEGKSDGVGGQLISPLARHPLLTEQLLEYGVHRFVFHIERFLPDHPFFLMIHFTAHGIHHYIPVRLPSSHLLSSL